MRVVRAERAAQNVGDQNQHFVAIQVPKAVIDPFEVVNVHHRQPVLYGLTGGG